MIGGRLTLRSNSNLQMFFRKLFSSRNIELLSPTTVESMSSMPEGEVPPQPKRSEGGFNELEDAESQFLLLKALSKSKKQVERLERGPEFLELNRFKDVPAFGDTLVWLGDGTRSPENYVHANLVELGGLQGSKTSFFAAQAPTEKGVRNFLRMIAEKKVKLVVSLVSSPEVGTRCERFWPEDSGTFNFGEQKVTCSSVEKSEFFERRSLKISTRGKKSHRFEHLHFFSWGDKSAPDPRSLPSLLALFDEVETSSELHSCPILVHCVAGIGRTGTFIAAYFLTRKPQRGFEAKSVFEVCSKIRECRYKAVQKLEQYVFLTELQKY